MAIATSTAIGLGIAAASTAASVGMNLSAAAKQSKAADAAQQAASEAAAAAEAEYQKEFMGGVKLPMEAYQQAGREGTAQQMQSLQALQEADTRSLAAGVGKVQAEATNQQAGVTEQMRKDMLSLESAQAEEKMANRDQIAKMNQDRVIGAQTASANAEAARANALASAVSSVGNLAGQASQAATLYDKTGETSVVLSNSKDMVNTTYQSPVSSRFSNNITDTSIIEKPGNAAGFGGIDYSLSSFGVPPKYPNTFGPQQYRYPDWSNNLSSFRFR